MSKNKSNLEQNRVAIIIIDSGFSAESVGRIKNLLAYRDLSNGFEAIGRPLLKDSDRQEILARAQDPLNHGTVVLERFLALDSELPFILVRAFSPDGSLIRSRFEDGRLTDDGWTEAYLWAQHICVQSGYFSVANCSFGGFHHALDGSGWEAYQLGLVVGKGKAGHLIAAAAGPGDGRAIHASLALEGGQNKTVFAQQPGPSTYNLWVDRDAKGCAASADTSSSRPETRDFTLGVTLNGESRLFCQGSRLGANLWNGKQQLTFDLSDSGLVAFNIALADGAPARFDIFISREDGARFSNFIDTELVSEPAVFSQVIAVGLENGFYGDCQVQNLTKPDVLLPGDGPISFRTPEVTYRLSRLLSASAPMDVVSARAQFGK